MDKLILVETWCENYQEGFDYLHYNQYEPIGKISNNIWEVEKIGIKLRDVKVIADIHMTFLSHIDEIKEILKDNNGYWFEPKGFVVCLNFKMFPQCLKNDFDALIKANGMEYETGYLNCEYYMDDDDIKGNDGFGYMFMDEGADQNVGKYFNTPEFNAMIKELAMEIKSL